MNDPSFAPVELFSLDEGEEFHFEEMSEPLWVIREKCVDDGNFEFIRIYMKDRPTAKGTLTGNRTVYSYPKRETLSSQPFDE